MDSEDEFESADEEDDVVKEEVQIPESNEPEVQIPESNEPEVQISESNEPEVQIPESNEPMQHPLSQEANENAATEKTDFVETPAADNTISKEEASPSLQRRSSVPDTITNVPDTTQCVHDTVTSVPDTVTSVPDTAKPANKSSEWGWGGWSSWAASSITQVADIATKTGQGLSGALESFESSLGIPTPDELAAEMRKEAGEEPGGESVEKEIEEEPKKEEKEEDKEEKKEEKKESGESSTPYYPGAGLWSGLSSLSSTGTKLLYTGMEHIEKASNQAYEALNDQTTEPGYQDKKKKIKDTAKGTNLMTVLQEARTKYEADETISREVQRTMSYLFDERQGLSQLEALDMLSKECVAKLRTYTPDSRMQTLFLYIETSMELKDPDSELIIEQLGAAVTDCLKTININLPITKLNQCRYEIAQKLSEMDMCSMDETAKPSDIAQTATLDTGLYSIADFAARSVEVFKKIAELTLMKATLEVDVKTQSDTIKFLNEVLCCEIDNIRAQFEQKLKKSYSINEKELNTLYLESSNAISYVQEPLYFFVPILQWLVVKGFNAK